MNNLKDNSFLRLIIEKDILKRYKYKRSEAVE